MKQVVDMPFTPPQVDPKSRVMKNEITQDAAKSSWNIFLAQLKSPLVLILIGACLFTLAIQDWIEAGAIFVILLGNTTIGFFQESRAQSAVLALRDMTAPRATVIRDGRQMIIPSVDVKIGDILVLEAGDVVAADADLIEAAHFQVNEAVLTGESHPVEKSVPQKSEKSDQSDSDQKRSGNVFMGTSVTAGSARAKVTRIGMDTQLGKIAHLIKTAKVPATPLQVQLAKIGKTLAFVCLGIIVLVFVFGAVNHTPWVELIVFSIALAVAVVPEGMPAIVTVALALGVRRMAARHALVRNLPGVETLGGVTVICTDKTGTLTTGKMQVRDIFGAKEGTLLLAAASCCDAELKTGEDTGIGDATEVALLLRARELNIHKVEIEKANPRITTHPFDSIRRRMSIFRKSNKLFVKGAVENILPKCPDSSIHRAILEANQAMATRGLRVLAIATGNTAEETNLTVLGLIGIADPPRLEVRESIQIAKTAGIHIVMITGDHAETAQAIAIELGILMPGEDPKEIVFARATPEVKLSLVRKLKDGGSVIAMIGDGVNDAPALREAHIGIAMGRTGTEVTRQAADLILGDDNFATIVGVVKEGRGIYQNIRQAIVFLLAGNFAELLTVLGASAFGLPLPFLASHLLWINLVTDSLPALALVTEPVSNDVMAVPPRSPKQLLLGRAQWTRIGGIGGLEGGLMLVLFAYTLKNDGLAQARSLTFTALVFSQLFRSLSARSNTRIFLRSTLFGNRWLILVFAVTACLQLSLHYIPFTQRVFGLVNLRASDLITILLFSIATTTFIELKKLFQPRKKIK